VPPRTPLPRTPSLPRTPLPRTPLPRTPLHRRRILRETGRLLAAFLLGSATTVVGAPALLPHTCTRQRLPGSRSLQAAANACVNRARPPASACLRLPLPAPPAPARPACPPCSQPRGGASSLGPRPRALWLVAAAQPARRAAQVGTVVAMKLFPLTAYLGAEGWKIAAALTARHIGGAVNYMAVTDALGVSPSIVGAGACMKGAQGVSGRLRRRCPAPQQACSRRPCAPACAWLSCRAQVRPLAAPAEAHLQPSCALPSSAPAAACRRIPRLHCPACAAPSPSPGHMRRCC
jgi:hypothetical protein